jgi:hypothetical protein
VSILVWAMMGIALWHFAVFVPDRFWGGIVGAFGAALLGALVVGFAVSGADVEDPNIVTALEAIPGAILGLGISYYAGVRAEEQTS